MIKKILKQLAIIAAAFIVGLLIGRFMMQGRPPAMGTEQMNAQIEYMEAVSRVMQIIMDDYDQSVIWNKLADQEPAEKTNLKGGN